jgi:peptide deformylase
MAARPILRYPDPRLRVVCKPVTNFDESLRKLAADLADSMIAVNGRGLAANQVGYDASVFVVEADTAGRRGSPPLVFVNPVVGPIGDETVRDDEGCLSFPGVFVPVLRPRRAWIKARDLSGQLFDLAAEGMFARALLHEADHLAGRLLVDVVGPVTRKIILTKLRKLDRRG